MPSFIEELTVPSQVTFLQDIRMFVDNSVGKTGMNESDRAKVILAVDEGSANIIEHAYGGQSGFVKIRVEAEDDKVTINLYDGGESGFDPNKVPDPDIKEHVRLGKKSGLGVFLMRKIMDELDYNFKEGEYNHLRLVKRIQK